MKLNKKTILIAGITEGVILVFALVLSIIVWATIHNEEEAIAAGMLLPDYNIKMNGAFIAFFQNNPIAFFLIICLPIFLIIALDFVYLALTAYKRESKLSDAQLAAIRKKAEAEVKAEIMKELMEAEVGEDKKPEEEKPADEEKKEEKAE